ncbi:MAG: hypothetical protein QOG67_1617 [Verrucomicrobiota bacterium]
MIKAGMALALAASQPIDSGALDCFGDFIETVAARRGTTGICKEVCHPPEEIAPSKGLPVHPSSGNARTGRAGHSLFGGFLAWDGRGGLRGGSQIISRGTTD